VSRLGRCAGAAAIGLLLGAGGCGAFGSSERNPPCPKVFIAGETADLTRFRSGAGRDITDIEFEAEVAGYTGSCTYTDKKLTVELDVSLQIARGPANASRSVELEYYVAVPKLFPSEAGKRVFPVSVAFEANQTRTRYIDPLVVEFPLAQKAEGPSYEVYIGFQLTREELEFNRNRRRR
jgi:hypothetical protein